MTKRLALFAALAFLASTPDARADSIPMTPGTAGKNLALSADGSANSYPNHVFCGGATATIFATVTNCAIVNASGQVLTLDAQSGAWTVTANAGTNLNTSLLATSANQTNATQKTQIVDGAGNVIASTSNNLDVQCANCSGSGVSTADQATFTAGASLFAGSGGFFQTTATNNPLTNGQQGLFQATANRAIFANLRNAAGTEIATASTPLQVSLANTAANAAAILTTGTGGTFPITAASLPLPTGAATSALQPTNAAQGSTTSGQTGRLIEGAVTTASPTYTTGQTSPFSLDLTGALRVNVTAGGGSGGTSSSFGSAFPGTGTAAGAEYLTTPPTLTTGQMVALQTDINGDLKIHLDSCTSPVCNVNGSATGANSSPVVIASDQGAVATKAASAAYASGALVDITNLTGTKNAGTAAANSLLAGGVFNSSPLTLTTGQQASLQLDASGFLDVNIKAGAGSGGTALTDNTAFTQSTTSETPIGCLFITSYTAATSGRSTIPQCDSTGHLLTVSAAGSAIMGKVGIDQTTPGTTNAISVGQIGATTVLTGTGAVGAGAQRFAVGTDSATVAGSAPAAAGFGVNGSAPPSGTEAVSAITGGATGGLLAGVIQAGASGSISVTATGFNQILALSSGRAIYITSYEITASGGANTVQWEYGTGTNCATGAIALSGVNSYLANGGASRGSGLGPIMVVPAGNELCLGLGSATLVTGSFSYAQF